MNKRRNDIGFTISQGNEKPSSTAERCVCVYPEDMQFMAAHALSYGEIETGGALFGLRTHRDNIVIMSPLGPGPNATRGGAHFVDDPNHILEASKFLFDNHALQYVGNHHSHHCLNLRSPSAVDSEQIRRLSIRNNYVQQIQLIITYETGHPQSKGSCYPSGFHDGRTASKGSQAFSPLTTQLSGDRTNTQIPFVRISAYYYANAQTGSYVRSKLMILKGKNPIRSSLSAIGLIPSLGTVDDMYFPLDRIIFDEFEATPAEQSGPQMPEALANKLNVLTEDILAKSEVTIGDDSLTIELPLSNTNVLTLIIALKDPYPIRKLLLTTCRGDEPRDVICRIIKAGGADDLPAIYQWAQVVADSNGHYTGMSDHYRWHH